MAIKLTSGQQTFVRQLARKTGLNSRVLSAWVVAEEGGANSSAAQGRQASKNHNWLNIGYFDSGAGSITKSKVFSNPVSAADATAEFLEGKKFGASSGIRRILSTVGKSQEAQIHAIATSGWASSGYNGGNNLRQLLGIVPAPGKASGTVGQAISSAGARAAAVPTTTQTVTPGVIPTPADASPLLAALSAQQSVPAAAQTMPLVQPGATAGPTFSKSYRAVQASGGGARALPQSNVSALLAAAVQTPQGELPVGPTVTTTTTAPAAAGSGSASGARTAPQASQATTGKVVVAGGAERAGKGLQKPILSFLHQLAGRSGRTVTVTTGTNHNQYVAGEPGVQSDHWDGNAADLGLGGDARQSPAVAHQGDLIAAHAIQLAAGISFKKAYAIAKAGGVHNFETKAGRVQVLWKTMVGGNHYNHVHVGVNPGR